jgi:Kef-type K+ transport system membrane component KefB
VAFIGVGIGVGPVGLGWVEGGDQIELLAKLGIAVLLFLVGLKLDLHLIRTTGRWRWPPGSARCVHLHWWAT